MAETMHMDIKAIFNVYMLVLCYMIYLVPKICPINMKYLKVSLVLVRLVVFVYNESTYYKK